MNRLALAAALLAPAALAQDPPIAQRDESAELFAGRVVRIALELPDESRTKLRDAPRSYVAATARIDGEEWKSVGVKLKGAAGSFREFDDRPGLTVDLDRFAQDRSFRGLTKFHLNNAVQDPTWLHEWLGAAIFTAAGYQAPRVAHAVLELDGRELGLYVLREAFDERFLLRCFGDARGNLYDGGFCQDVDADLEKDSGAGPDDHADLHALVAACGTVADDVGRAHLASLVDVDALIDFVALEAMVGHWDGYALNRNNYRLFIDARDGRARFLPHGMDQLFGEPEASVLRHPIALVASAVLAQPEWRKRYRQRLRAMVPLFAPERWRSRIAAKGDRLEPAVRAMGDDARNSFREAIRDLQERVTARHADLVAQSKAPEPKPLEFRGDRAIVVKGWHPAGESEGIALRKRSVDGVPSYELACVADGEQSGAWRTTVLLARGRYRFTASVRCADLRSTSRDDQGAENGGAGLAVDDSRSERVRGDRRWTALACEFEVAEFQREVELAVRLRADHGSAWFRLDSLQLARIAD